MPLQHVELRIAKHPAWCFDGECVTCDAHRRLLIDFPRWYERCCDRNVVRCGHDRVAVVKVVFSVIVVPLGVLITLTDANICPVDSAEFAEQVPLGKFVDYLDEDLFSNVFKNIVVSLSGSSCGTTYR